jgi:hypothetical protein
VPIARCHCNQRGDLRVGEPPQLREVRHQRERAEGTDPWHTTHQILARAPAGAGTQELVPLLLDLRQVCRSADQMRLDPCPYARHWRRAQPMLRGRAPGHDLASPLDQCCQLLGWCSAQRPRRRMYCLSTVGKHLGIQLVGLRPLPRCTGTSTHLAWVHSHDGPRGEPNRRDE